MIQQFINTSNQSFSTTDYT